MLRRAFLKVLSAGASLVVLPTSGEVSADEPYEPIDPIKPVGFTDAKNLWTLRICHERSHANKVHGVEPGRLILVRNDAPTNTGSYLMTRRSRLGLCDQKL